MSTPHADPQNPKYRDAGVDIEAGHRAVALMRDAVRATHSAQVLADVGSFGGLFALDGLPEAPVLVASTDGVGTKVKLAAERGAWRAIGHDIVNHCANDILVQGARPLDFWDYLAASRLVPEQVAEVVTGMADACRALGCALLGGETAEMPGVYAEGAFDVAGTIVGLVGRAALLPRPETMVAGDALVGLASSGPHTNGYSLIRQLVAGRDLAAPFDGSGQPLGAALLAPHRAYGPAVARLAAAAIPLKGMAHITGGGFVDNLPRILPPALDAELWLASWQVPPLFQRLADWGAVAQAEAYHVWNMGIGMVLVVAASDVAATLAELPDARHIGRLVQGSGEPRTWLRESGP